MGESKLRYYKPASLGKQVFDVGHKVHEILESGSFTKGDYVDELAMELQTKTGYEHAILFGSGTAAIFILARWYKSLGYKRILCPAFTWPSTYLPFEWCAFHIAFCDIDPETWLADFGDMKPQGENSLLGPELFIPVDTFGNVVPHGDFYEMIDSAQSLGADWGKARNVNRIISLSGSKIVTSGEGGALLTQDKELAKFAEETGAWFSRMPEMSAVIGLAFLSQLSRIVEAKREIANSYQKIFPQLQWQKIPHDTNNYIVAGLVDDPMNIVLQNSNIEMRQYYQTMVNETNVITFDKMEYDLPNTKAVSRHILAFPSWPDMDLERIKEIRI